MDKAASRDNLAGRALLILSKPYMGAANVMATASWSAPSRRGCSVPEICSRQPCQRAGMYTVQKMQGDSLARCCEDCLRVGISLPKETFHRLCCKENSGPSRGPCSVAHEAGHSDLVDCLGRGHSVDVTVVGARFPTCRLSQLCHDKQEEETLRAVAEKYGRDGIATNPGWPQLPIAVVALRAGPAQRLFHLWQIAFFFIDSVTPFKESPCRVETALHVRVRLLLMPSYCPVCKKCPPCVKK